MSLERHKLSAAIGGLLGQLHCDLDAADTSALHEPAYHMDKYIELDRWHR
jgi:hypothetical protein